MVLLELIIIFIVVTVQSERKTIIQIPLNSHTEDHQSHTMLRGQKKNDNSSANILAKGLINQQLLTAKRHGEIEKNLNTNMGSNKLFSELENFEENQMAENNLERARIDSRASEHKLEKERMRDRHEEKIDEANLEHKKIEDQNKLESLKSELYDLEGGDAQLKEKEKEIEDNTKKLQLLNKNDMEIEIEKDEIALKNLAEAGREDIKSKIAKYSPTQVSNMRKMIDDCFPSDESNNNTANENNNSSNFASINDYDSMVNTTQENNELKAEFVEAHPDCIPVIDEESIKSLQNVLKQNADELKTISTQDVIGP